MSVQRIDHIFKQRLGDGSMPVPEDLWGQIEPHLPSVRRANRWGLIWITGAGVLAMAAMILWIASFDKEAPVALMDQSALSQEKAAANSSQFNSDSDAATSTTRPDLNSEHKSLLASTTTNSSISHLRQVTRQVTRNTAVTNPMTSRGSAVATTSNSFSKEDDVDEKAISESIIAEDESIGVTMKNTIYSERLALKSAFLTLPFHRKLPDPAKDCYSFGRKGSSGGGGVLFAEAYTGPGVSIRKLSSRAEDVSAYIAQRDSTESSRLSWHAGLRIGYWHHSGITARIGGHYTQVNERFDYVNGSYVGTVTRIDTIFDGGGNIIDIDTVLVPVSGQRIKTTHNRYHTLDIPLLIGYQVAQGNWTYGIQAGPVFNVAFIKKGDILSPIDGEPVSISDNNANQYPAFKDKLGMSVYASAHIAYRIGYRTSMYAEPYLHHRLKTLTLDSYPIDQRQTNVGLSIGLRVMLQ